MIEDLKHALKTAHNNLFTGAKLLTLGNHVAMYAYACNLAFGSNSPLYHHDVEKTDQQDGNVATRITSSGAVAYLTKYHPDRLGFIIYLFVFSKLVDAYQNPKNSTSRVHQDVFTSNVFFRDVAVISQGGRIS